MIFCLFLYNVHPFITLIKYDHTAICTSCNKPAYTESMCGIVGYCGYQNAKDVVLDGLCALEYRGYDSAGIATVGNDIDVIKAVGQVSQLRQCVGDIVCHTSIGHTRWATHGEPSVQNAHPHLSFDGKIAIVHNGVIENCDELKNDLIKKGITFSSMTDSEIIAHMIALQDTSDMISAIVSVANKLKGAKTFLAVKAGEEAIYMYKCGASLAVGIGDNQNFVASDTLAISCYTNKIVVLKDHECAKLTRHSVTFFENGIPIKKTPATIKRARPKECTCHMQAEIDEISFALQRTHKCVVNLFDSDTQHTILNASKIYFVGCGTAYHAGLYGKDLFEKYLYIPCECCVASEINSLRFIDENSVVFAITQSGETADTLLAVQYCQQHGAKVIALTNVEGSSITFYANKTLLLNAGAEIAVCATKSYNCQLLALYVMACTLISKKIDLTALYSAISDIATQSLYEERIKRANLFFLGKGQDYITAKEGALKFKEITYKMADAYSVGELKHGTIALVDERSIAIIIATNPADALQAKATISELKSRKAYTIAITSISNLCADKTLQLKNVDSDLYPILSIIPLQTLALTSSLCLGLNPDKPRNLAKSVTVI